MVDLRQLSVSQWLLVARERGIGVDANIEVEDVASKWLGDAKGPEEERCAERRLGGEELDGDVLLCLSQLLALRRCIGGCRTHKIYFALARLLHGESKCSFQASIWVLEE